MPASADGRTSGRHRHQDYVFVSEWAGDACDPETMAAWLSEPEVVGREGLAEDSRLLAITIFAHVRALLGPDS